LAFNHNNESIQLSHFERRVASSSVVRDFQDRMAVVEVEGIDLADMLQHAWSIDAVMVEFVFEQ
jgi:hypothetical protein